MAAGRAAREGREPPRRQRLLAACAVASVAALSVECRTARSPESPPGPTPAPCALDGKPDRQIPPLRNPGEHFAAAKRAFDAGHWDQAAEMLRPIVRRQVSAGDEAVQEAQYLLAVAEARLGGGLPAPVSTVRKKQLASRDAALEIMTAIVEQPHHRRRREAAEWLCERNGGKTVELGPEQRSAYATRDSNAPGKRSREEQVRDEIRRRVTPLMDRLKASPDDPALARAKQSLKDALERLKSGDLAAAEKAIAEHDASLAGAPLDATAGAGEAAGRTVRFRCPGGQTPTAVRTGCICSGGGIENPCKTGGTWPRVDGDACVFQCPAESAEWTPQTDHETCLKKCNDETAWRHTGQCQLSCEAQAPPPGGWSPEAMKCAPERRAACERQAAQRKLPCKERALSFNGRPGDDCRIYGLCRTNGDQCVEGCDDADVKSGQCARWCAAGAEPVCKWLCGRNEDERSCSRLCRGGDADACLSMCGGDQGPCNRLCRAGHEAACSYADYESAEAGRAVAERKRRAAAAAKLPGLFAKCESNRARIFRWKKKWIAAKRKGDWEKAQEAEGEVQKLEPEWAATLSAIREAIRESTGDEGERFRQLVGEVKRRCSLPSWAGFF